MMRPAGFRVLPYGGRGVVGTYWKRVVFQCSERGEGCFMKTELESICDLVRACGEIIKNADRGNLHVDAKSGHANFVTEYDKLVQEKLRVGLQEIMPDARFIGEEGSTQQFAPIGKFFVVDPIDGTQNFIKDYHLSCVSVALIVDGAAELGVVYNPYTDEMFTAQRGAGSFCNGRRLAVSAQPLENAVVLFGTSPYHEDLSERSFKLAYSLFRRSLDVRRSGSAALDLCAVAAGRAELFFELALAPWDYAAGALIVQEAGGMVTTVDGGALAYDRQCPVFARGTGISDTALDEIKQV